MTHRGLAAATGLILRLPAWVISAFQSAQPGPGPDSSDRLNADHDSDGDRLVKHHLGRDPREWALGASLSFSLIRGRSAAFVISCHACCRRRAVWSER